MLQRFITILTDYYADSDLQPTIDNNCKSIQDVNDNSTVLKDNEFTTIIIDVLKNEPEIFWIDQDAVSGAIDIRYHAEFDSSLTENEIESNDDEPNAETVAILNNDNVTVVNPQVIMLTKRLFRIGVIEVNPRIL